MQIAIQGESAISLSLLEEAKESDKDRCERILVLKPLGMSNVAIAKNLGISESGVRYWLSKTAL